MERCCFWEDVLVAELRRQSRRLRPLAVEVILAVSESWIGERNSDSGTVEVVPKVNARACVGVGAEDIWEVQYSFVPVINGGHDECRPVPVRTCQVLNVAQFGTDDDSELWAEGVGTVCPTRVRERKNERGVTALRTHSLGCFMRTTEPIDGGSVETEDLVECMRRCGHHALGLWCRRVVEVGKGRGSIASLLFTNWMPVSAVHRSVLGVGW